jgi:hypothetical protein
MVITSVNFVCATIPARGFLDCQLDREPGWHEACVLAESMTARSVMHVIATVVFVLAAFVMAAHSQPSTASPSSLATTPLSPGMTDPAGGGSCGLCRPLEGRRGSDLRQQWQRQDKGLHPHRQPKGLTKSHKRSLMNQLPRRKLEGDRQKPEE